MAPGAPPPRPSQIDPQTAAVRHGKGPCLVLAAPGSGKTRVIVERFCRLVREEQLRPEQILVMTYTTKAAGEMRDRVAENLGPISGEPTLTTFNAWALDLVRRFGWHIGLDERVRIASGAEQWTYLAEAIEEVNPRFLYNPAKPYDSVRTLQRVIQRAKQELVTPERYHDAAVAKLRGAEPPEWHEAQRQSDVAEVYARLQKKFTDAGVLDHDDCVALAVRLLDEPSVRAYVREHYRYVMVDEYQDTNTAQEHLLEKLVDAMNGVRRGNLLVVADDDQAIYRFRGASQVNIRRFREHFPARKELALLHNWRSTPQIVAVNQKVIERAVARETKVVEAARPDGAPVAVISAPTDSDEAMTIVEVIRQRLAAGARPRDIAVLFRNHSEMKVMMAALQAAAIPYVSRGGNDFFRATEVGDMMALLQAIDDPAYSGAVLALTRFPQWRFSKDGQRIADQWIRRGGVPLITMLHEGSLPGLSDRDRAMGRRLARSVHDLHMEALTGDVRDLYAMAMEQSGNLRFRELRRDVERMQFSANLGRLGAILDEYCQVPRRSGTEASRRQPRTLHEALEYLDLMDRSGSEGVAPLRADLDGIQLSTIHGAKGLEWPHVIVAGCADGKLPARRHGEALGLPREFLDDDLSVEDAHLQEELHLFYVAGTRARDTLVYTYPLRYGNDGATRKSSRFFDSIPPELVEVSEAPGGAEPLLPRPRVLPEPLPDGRLTLSYSAIYAYKRQRQEPGESAIPPQHERMSEEARLGVLVHEVLSDAMRLRDSGAPVDEPLVLSLWERSWQSSAEGMRQSRRNLHDFGASMLQSYVRSESWKNATVQWIEYPFELDMGAGVSLKGRLDRVDVRNGAYTVIDYKTGLPPKDESSLRYDDQMIIYAIAVADLTGASEVTCEKHFLQTGDVRRVTFNAEQIAKNRGKIAALCRRIRADVEAQRPAVTRPAPPAHRPVSPRRATPTRPQPPAPGPRRAPSTADPLGL